MGSIFSAALDRTAARLDRWLGWDRLPLPIAILTLVGLRGRLRDENLFDTGKGRRASASTTITPWRTWASPSDAPSSRSAMPR